MNPKKVVFYMQLNPESRLCPRFDFCSIAKYELAKKGEMGVYIVDNCSEEHIM